MIVPDNVRKSVVFLGYQMHSGEMRLAGSAFFLGTEIDGGQATDVFLVTAKHVIEGIRKLGLLDVHIRANRTDGQSVWEKYAISEWDIHPDPSVDVAILQIGVPQAWDHLVIPLSMCATRQKLQEHEVGLGDEVFIVGLFRHHFGTQRNIPIVRVGNLAVLTEEKVKTSSGLVDAYLIEARSIGGLSGSPVFLNLGVVRYVEKRVKHSTSGPVSLLLGLIHGHYDNPRSSFDNSNEDANDSISTERINMGIAIVVPVEKIQQMLQNLPRRGLTFQLPPPAVS